jgi:hypothetical protein
VPGIPWHLLKPPAVEEYMVTPADREKIHYELLEALYKARRHVEQLEAALAHNAAFLGTGIEREDLIGRPAPDPAELPDALTRYFGLVGHMDDISDYLGREGHAESRPRLGRDAPEAVRPADGPRIDRLVGDLILDHPDDGLLLSAGGADTPEQPNRDAPSDDTAERQPGVSLSGRPEDAVRPAPDTLRIARPQRRGG